MKKTLVLTVLAVLLLSLFPPAASAEDLPSIDSALSDYRRSGEGGRIRVKNSLNAYDPFNGGDLDYDDVRMLIFERRGAEKAFTESDVSCADPSYVPEDLGETELYLRTDMMDLLPSKARASSLNGADLILIAEDMYELESQIIHTEFEDSGADHLPDSLETPEELMAYLAAHPPVIKSRTYKPLFCAYTVICLYSTNNKASAIIDYDYYEYTLECNNEDAMDLWDGIAPLGDLLSILESDDPSSMEDEAAALLDSITLVPEETLESWRDLILDGEYGEAFYSAEDRYWALAGELPGLDDSEDAAEWYPAIIDARDRAALEAFVSFRNYSGVDTPDDVIIAGKLYIGQPDPDWFDEAIAYSIDLLLGD